MTGIPRPPNSNGKFRRYTFSVDAAAWDELTKRLDQYGTRARVLDWLIYFLLQHLRQTSHDRFTTDEYLSTALPTLQLSPRHPDGQSTDP